MSHTLRPDDKDAVQSKIDRVAAHAALHQMSQLAQQIKREEASDRVFVKRVVIVIALLAVLLMIPGLINTLMRWIAGLLH